MEIQKQILNFINTDNFDKNKVASFLSSRKITEKQLLKSSFKILKSLINSINTIEDKTIIYKTVSLIVFLCDDINFDKEEININKERIKKLREEILLYLKNNNDNSVQLSCNLLDEIVLDKAINDMSLLRIVKILINKKENVNIIKRIININKNCILIKKNSLFDYVFNKTMNSINSNESDINYYITLLKIIYFTDIDKTYYLNILKNSTSKNLLLLNEIYNVIMGRKRYLCPEDIKKKYNIDDTFKVPYNAKKNFLNKNSDTIITIDSRQFCSRDDGISITKDGCNYKIGIYIADPGYSITPESSFDLQCRKKFKSLFFERDKIDMMSYDTKKNFSLDKNKQKNVISLYIIVNQDMKILDYYLLNESIHTCENFSSREANKIINSERSSNFTGMISKLYELACINRQNNKDAFNYDNFASELIVKEFCSIYNEVIAHIALEMNYPLIYKVQEPCYISKLVTENNIEVDETTELVLKDIYLQPEFSSNPGMFNRLKTDAYTSAISPMRKYVDLYNQYLIHMFMLKNKKFNFNEKKFEELISYLNNANSEIRLFESEYGRELLLKKK